MDKKIAFLLSVFLLSNPIFADEQLLPTNQNPVEEREILENQQIDNPFSIGLYEPTYILPFSYNQSWNEAEQAETPDNQTLSHIEAKFQFSIQATIWNNFFHHENSLNFAYTQLSFWQVYKHSGFFRESNYQPEVFFQNTLDIPLIWGWRFHFLNFGFLHQSNGEGSDLERSWNRIYTELIFSQNNWMISIRPWCVIQGASLDNNPDIAEYLGYERVIIAYKFGEQTFSLLTYNLEHFANLSSFQFTWSFPLVRQFRGYVQGFSGYGQSLIEYNHHTNSISIGIALNDWI